MSERLSAEDFQVFCDVNGIGIAGENCVKRVLDFIHYAENAAADAELKPLKELLSKFMHGHDESASNASGDWMATTICQCGLCKAGRELRGW